MEEELKELELALNESLPGAIDIYKKAFEENGGKQFRPDPQKVKCKNMKCFRPVESLTNFIDPTRVESFQQIREIESVARGIPKSRLSSNSHAILANDGIDLEIEW